MILPVCLLLAAVMCVIVFCHALCDALRAVQSGGDPAAQVVRMQVSLCGALLFPAAAVARVVIFLHWSI